MRGGIYFFARACDKMQITFLQAVLYYFVYTVYLVTHCLQPIMTTTCQY